MISDRIKAQAKRAAWENNDDINSPFNPFRKPRLTSSDVESGAGEPRSSATADGIERSRTHHSSVEESADTGEWPARHHHPTRLSDVLDEEEGETESIVDENLHRHKKRIGNAQPHAKQTDSISDDAIDAIQDEKSEPQKENEEMSAAIQSARRRRISPIGRLLRGFQITRGRYPIRSQLRVIFFNSWFHLLQALIPVGFALYYTKQNPVAVFFVNFAAMIPSIMILTFMVDEVILRFGETVGGLISMTFSNASQLITSILLLRSRQILVLQTSLVGAILSNLLLTPGFAFLFGGINRVEQYFNITLAQTTGEMLLLATLSLLVPTAATALTQTIGDGVVKQSRGTSVVLLTCYGMFMFFQLKTHSDMYNEPSQKVEKRKTSKLEDGTALRSIATIGAGYAATAGGEINQDRPLYVEEDDEPEEPQLPLATAIIVLAGSTTILTFNTLFATNSIQGLLERVGLSETFLGLVILPILSNDPTTVMVAVKDKMDLTLGLTLGKCVQIALLVLPFIVILAWIMGIDQMTLSFGSFETLIMLTSVIVVNYIVQGGKSHWLVGFLLVAAYIIIAVAAFWIP